MSRQFEYGVAHIKDIQVKTRVDGQGRSLVESLELDGRPVQPSRRFWNSLHVRFGFTSNIFRYFDHAEVFEADQQVVGQRPDPLVPGNAGRGPRHAAGRHQPDGGHDHV